MMMAMMMRLPDIHPALWDDFSDAIRCYAKTAGAQIAIDFEACVYLHLEEIEQAPLLYQKHGRHGIRRLGLGPQFKNWSLAFVVWNGRATVLTLSHAKRRPLWFRERIAEARKRL